MNILEKQYHNAHTPYIKYTFHMIILLISSVCLVLFCRHSAFPAQTQSDKLIVDNFEKPGKENLVGGDFGAFADDNKLGYCYLFFIQNKEKDKLGASKYSLYIQWDSSKQGAYGGFWTSLKHLNLEKFNYVSFYVKGIEGGEIFKVGLRGKMDEPYETKILINEVLSNGVTTEWQRVTIPLKSFKSIKDWSDVNIFSINFEHAFGSKKGAVLIDEISFEK